jgi:hypothetical protein
MGEKGIDFQFSHFLGVADIVEKNEPFYTIAISLLCSAIVILINFPDLISIF